MNEEVKQSSAEQVGRVSVGQKVKYASLGAIVMLVATGVAGSAYYYGVFKPKQITVDKAIEQLFDPAAVLNLPETTTGKVQEVASDTLKVNSTQDGEVSVVVGRDVPITRKGQAISLQDIRNEETATVLYQNIDGVSRATRVIVR